jgi:hypothetical protein
VTDEVVAKAAAPAEVLAMSSLAQKNIQISNRAKQKITTIQESARATL